MAQTSAKWGWAGSNYHELAYFKVTQVKQERANNRTQFRVEIWTNSNNSRGDVGTVNWSVGDQSTTRASGSKFISSSSSNYVRRDIANTTFWIKHTSSGSLSQRTFTLNMDRNVGNIKSVKMSVKLSVSSLPQIPNAPTLSLRSRDESSVTLNWSTNMSVSRIRHRVGGGSWTTSSASGTSGTRTVSGLSTGGKTASIDVQVEGPGGWSSTRNTSQRTQHVSTLSSYSLVPTYGYNNRLTLAVKGAQTGGSTTIQYKLSTWSSWSNTTGGGISGLANNTSYTVNLRAINSEGPIRTYNISARTHASPSGSFSLTQQNKTQITITHSSANATHADYSLNGGGWVNYSSGVRLTNRTPGTTYSIQVRFRNTSTGLTTNLATKSITMPANVVPTMSFSNIVRYQGYVAVRASGADSAQYRYRVSGGSWSEWVAANLTGTTRVPSSGNLTSNTVYQVESRVVDSQSKQWGAVRSGSFTTAAFKPPTVTVTSRKLTSLTFNITPSDSCKLTQVTNTDVPAWTAWRTATKSETVTKYNNALLAADTSRVYSFVFQDQYGRSGVTHTVNATAATQPLDTVSLALGASSAGNVDIRSFTSTNSFPKIILNATTSNYDKKTTFSLGARVKEISWKASTNHALIVEELRSLVAAATQTYYDISYITRYTEDGRTSPSTQSGTIRIQLNDSLLTAPTVKVSYENSRNQNMVLDRLYTKGINRAVFDYSKPEMVEGSPIKIARITFNGEEYSISKTTEGSIKSQYIINNINSSTATLYIEDNRGLKATRTFNVLYTNYSYPMISLSAYGRENGFSDIIELRDFRLAFTPTLDDDNINNTIEQVIIERAQGGDGDDFEELKVGTEANLIEHMALGEIGESGDYSRELVKVGPGATKDIDKWFRPDYAYRLNIYARDSFYDETGVQAELTGIVIATGKGLIFFDEYNRQIGVNTTAPRGRFEVDGDAYVTNIYALNSLFFNSGDLEDI